MAYQSLKISEAIKKIESFDYLIPDIQREFVWSAEQIELLFDSLMCDYPIGTMLFWEVTGDTKFEYRFYEFLKDYKDYFGTSGKAYFFNRSKDQNRKIVAVLDGQQRLTAFYIGVRGSYSIKKPRVSIKNKEENFQLKKLYLQIDGTPFDSDDGRSYNFKFLTDVEFNRNYAKWFPLHDVFNMKYEDINENEFLEKNKEGRKIISTLHGKLHVNETLNYYEEVSQDIDKALNIFIRLNNQGEPLNYSDLIMSIVISNWKFKDARKEFSQLIENLYDLEFAIKKDFILKLFLVLFNSDIKFLVRNFSANMARSLEENWDKLAEVLIFTAQKLVELGFSDKLLTSKNAVIPILYILYNVDNKEQYFQKNKMEIKNWLSLVLYLQAFSGSSDTILTSVRNYLHSNKNGFKEVFPKEEIIKLLKDGGHISTPDDGFIENTLFSGKISNYFYIGCILFPDHFPDIKKFERIIPELTSKQLKILDLDSDSENIILELINSYMNYTFIENGQPIFENKNLEFLEFFKNRNVITRNNYKNFIEIMQKRKNYLD
jgi:uncharacterized protein with ParB-like and HNH nuclease domain